MQAERGRGFGFVLGGDEAIGFVLVARFEGFLFLGNEVFAVKKCPSRGGTPGNDFSSHVSWVMSMSQPDPPP
jgi:hypothetical protein